MIKYIYLNMHMLALGMEMHMFDSYICGHHVTKNLWMPLIKLCAQGSGNHMQSSQRKILEQCHFESCD